MLEVGDDTMLVLCKEYFSSVRSISLKNQIKKKEKNLPPIPQEHKVTN
jgi:hypothetical protein